MNWSQATLLVAFICFAFTLASPQQHNMGADMPMMHGGKKPAKTTLKPAQGASVKILSPREGDVFTGDEIPIRYKFSKGKSGSHLHAYVDGELMGMFSHPETGTLTGIRPGTHTLELRVVANDHTTELKATDRVEFVVK